MARDKQIQIRRDVSSDWTAINPILASGEGGLETNTGKLKFGDGSTAWNDLPYLTQGEKGDKGDRGYQGTAGLKGDPGNNGAPGATGQTGLPGSTGATGAKGDKGDTGSPGTNGSNGAKGEKGDKGDTGNTGATGSPGLTGSQGIQGVKGDKGDKGDTGDAGTNGTNGTDGADGVIQSIVGGSGITVDDTDPANPEISTSGAVTSVNGDTGDVVLNQDDVLDGTTNKQYSVTEKTKLAGIEASADVTDATNVGAAGAFMKSVDDTDDIAVGSTNKFATAAEKTKLGFISVTQAVDLDTMESDIAGKQPLDSDLTTIAALDSSVAGALVTDGSGWIKKTYAQLKTALSLVKGDVGLGSVDNTSDVNKPVSTATQTALDAKVTGAASSTDNAVARYDLTTGKILQDSKLTVDDEGKIQYNTSGLTTAAALTSIISSSSTNNLGYANGVLRLIDNSMTINATSSQIVGRYFAVDTAGSVVKNDPSVTGWLPITYLFNSGGTYRADTNATGALAVRDMVGASNFDRINGGTLTVTEYSSFLSQGSVGAGVTITTLRGMWVTNLPTVSGTITNQIGIDIDAITKATTLAVGLRIGQPTTATTNRALQLTGTGTTVDGGIQFGGTSDTTNIYRSAASTLKTDGNLIVGTAGTAAGSAATVDGSQTLTNKTLSTGSVIDANVTVTEVLKKVYPIGCIYTSTNSTNPATSLGFGTWSAFGAGRVPVGFDSGQTEFDTDEETGGAKTVTLTSGEVPAHTHTLGTYANGNNNAMWHNNTAGAAVAAGDGAAANGSHTTSSSGSGGAHNNLQPYIVVRMWKRTA